MTTLEKETLKHQFEKHNLSAPSQKDEDWLYYDLDQLLNLELLDKTSEKKLETIDGHYLYFKNGVLEGHSLPDNVELKTKEIVPVNTKNSFIHFAIKTSQAIELTFNSCKATIKIIYDNSHSLHSTAISIVANESIVSIDRIFLCKEEKSITNNYMQMNTENNSTIVINEQNTHNQGQVFDFADASLEEDCHLIGLNQSYLSNKSRFQNRVFMNGKKATARLNGLAINEDDKQCFYNTHIYHNVGENESHQLFKSVNKSNALFEYNGKVSVKKDAQLINSYQLNQNILLDEYATIHSRPQLFIDADDVKCTHGSTTGDLNKEEIFYLMSRGLDELTSRKMVLKAFIDECFDHELLRPFTQNMDSYLNHII